MPTVWQILVLPSRSRIQSSNRQKHQPLNSYVSMSSEEWENEVRTMLQQSPENIVIAQENAAHLESKIRNQLSKFENQVLDMYLDGDNYLTIADKMGKTPKSIDNALQRIRMKVKERVAMKRQDGSKDDKQRRYVGTDPSYDGRQNINDKNCRNLYGCRR